MASKSQHVQDNSVVERRLRPIYDWLDSGNNKKALQECDKVLKKTPNLHCAKALKALTLFRMGKENECVAILDALTAETPTDDPTLQAMTLCCRELQQLDRICKLFESAVALDPTNEELYTHQFMAYVRVGDFKAQQRCAMHLYRQKPKNPYYCWAVMSVVLQATRGEGRTDAQKRTVLLKLAERMMRKLIDEGRLEAEQEVQLYAMVLELQGRYAEVLDVVAGPLGEKLYSGNVQQLRLVYLMKLERWSEVNLACKRVLVDSVDRWDIWKEYINSVIELMPSASASSGGQQQEQLNNHTDNHDSSDNDIESVDDTPEKAHEFICRIVENGADNGYLLRGPYLARFELCSRLNKINVDTNDLLGETIELFIEYFRKFGHKQCCVLDLMIYLNLLDQDKKLELASRLIKDVGISSTSVPQTEHQMQRHICALQLSRLSGTYVGFSADHLKALVTALSLHYQHGQQTYGGNLLSTDLGPSDPYALLAAHILYDLAQIEQSSEPIIVALALLASLLKNSPSNFHAKLLCIRLYHTIGASLGAHEMYNSLDVKHLQLDSLGYIHAARLPTTGLFTYCINSFDTTLKFFSSNYKDSSDHLTFSYKFGSFIKLEEFMDFRERLNNSLHYTTTAVDRIILSLVLCVNTEGFYNLDISPKDNKIEWDELRDNHDLRVYSSWDPERTEYPPEESPEIKKLFQQDITFLKLRTYILWSMSAALDLVKSNEDKRPAAVTALKKVLEDWDKLHTQVTTESYCSVPILQNQVTMPLPSRIHLFLSSPFLSIFKQFYSVLLNIAADSMNDVSRMVDDTSAELDKLVKSIENTTKLASDLQQNRVGMEYVVNNVEILSISSLICVLCSDLIKPTQGKKGRRKATCESSSAREHLVRLMSALKSSMNSVDAILQSWTPPVKVNDLDSKLESLNIDGATILEHITQSHATAVKELQATLKIKIKFLNGLG